MTERKWIILIIISIAIALLILILVSVISTLGWNAKNVALGNKQQELAATLQVKINNYIDPSGFPIGYFESVLIPGMTYEEVHKIVRGYTQVLNCIGNDEGVGKNDDIEVYFYFSTEDTTAIKFDVWYENGKFIHFTGYDSDAGGLVMNTKGAIAVGFCTYGLGGR
jgi:hypothetical protein